MAEYKSIKGFNIQYLDSDPPNPIEGQMWYNSTTRTFKGVEGDGTPAGTWASGGNLNTGRFEVSSGGTQTSSIIGGGRSAGAPPGLIMNNAETYNGSAWTAIATINTARRSAQGAGTSNTAAIIYGGPSQPSPPFSNSTNTESWNGSAWTEVNDLNTGKGASFGSMGSQTAAISVQDITCELWNGTSWTEVNDLNTPRGNTAFFGTSTSSVLATGTQTTNAESWNGTSWTAIAATNQAREGGAGAGTDNTIGIIFSGNYDPVGAITQTEHWNGSSWTEVNDLSTGRFGGSGSGSQTAALLSGGNAPPSYNLTEEWTAPDIIVKTLTTS